MLIAHGAFERSREISKRENRKNNSNRTSSAIRTPQEDLVLVLNELISKSRKEHASIPNDVEIVEKKPIFAPVKTAKTMKRRRPSNRFSRTSVKEEKPVFIVPCQLEPEIEVAEKETLETPRRPIASVARDALASGRLPPVVRDASGRHDCRSKLKPFAAAGNLVYAAYEALDEAEARQPLFARAIDELRITLDAAVARSTSSDSFSGTLLRSWVNASPNLVFIKSEIVPFIHYLLACPPPSSSSNDVARADVLDWLFVFARDVGSEISISVFNACVQDFVSNSDESIVDGALPDAFYVGANRNRINECQRVKRALERVTNVPSLHVRWDARTTPLTRANFTLRLTKDIALPLREWTDELLQREVMILSRLPTREESPMCVATTRIVETYLLGDGCLWNDAILEWSERTQGNRTIDSFLYQDDFTTGLENEFLRHAPFGKANPRINKTTLDGLECVDSVFTPELLQKLERIHAVLLSVRVLDVVCRRAPRPDAYDPVLHSATHFISTACEELMGIIHHVIVQRFQDDLRTTHFSSVDDVATRATGFVSSLSRACLLDDDDVDVFVRDLVFVALKSAFEVVSDAERRDETRARFAASIGLLKSGDASSFATAFRRR